MLINVLLTKCRMQPHTSYVFKVLSSEAKDQCSEALVQFFLTSGEFVKSKHGHHVPGLDTNVDLHVAYNIWFI